MKIAFIFVILINLIYFSQEWCLETCTSSEYCEYYTICRDCNIYNCSSCSDSSTCTQCLDGFYLLNSQCRACPSQCTACFGITECSGCNEGYYLSGGSCFNCPNGCATCSDTGATCSSCLPGYYQNGTSCWNCIWNCASCTGPNTCNYCQEKYTGPKCQCQDPLVWNSSSSSCVQSQNWAVIICGSSGFSYYRHQADTCHAYQTLINKGISKNNIIVFSYNDVVYSSDNPYQGKLFNKPCNVESDCWDVYDGCQIDYSGSQVLSGNSAAMKNIGSGKVLASNSSDNIFIYYVDDFLISGGNGILGVPGGQYIYYNNLSTVLNQLHNQNKYNQIVFYIEASESGSMVYNYSPSMNIYFLTSTTQTGASYGTYCSPNNEVMGVFINTCLADMFSVNWMEDTDNEDVTQITLEQQFSQVKSQTTNSTVSQWGDLGFTGETMGAFLGQNAMSDFIEQEQQDTIIEKYKYNIQKSKSLVYLQLKSRWINDPNNLTKKIEYFEEQIKNDKATLFFTRLATDVNKLDLLEHKSFLKIENWDCYKESIELYESKCMKLTGFSKYYLNVLAGLCEDKENINPIYYLKQKIIQYC